MNQNGQAVLISGASKGIGYAAALNFSKQGMLVFAGVRQQSNFDALLALNLPQLTPVFLEVASLDSIRDALAVVQTHLQPDTTLSLINNAGLAMPGPLEVLPHEDFKHQFEVNVFGVVALTQACLPLIRGNPDTGRTPGRIIMMSSISGEVAVPYNGAYCASKFALESLSASLRMELKHCRIPVSVIGAGPIQTPMWATGRQQAFALEPLLQSPQFTSYEKAMHQLDRLAQQSEQNALPVSAMVKVLDHALRAKHPKRRYRLGRNLAMVTVLRTLPISLREWMIGRILNSKG